MSEPTIAGMTMEFGVSAALGYEDHERATREEMFSRPRSGSLAALTSL